MKRFLVILAAFSVIGCNSKSEQNQVAEQPELPDFELVDETPTLQHNDGALNAPIANPDNDFSPNGFDAPQLNAPQNQSFEQSQQAEIEFADNLLDLTKQAKHFEQTMQYDNASQVWLRIEEILVEKYGAESWQTANARLAQFVALTQARFDNEQLQKLDRIRDIQPELNEQLKNPAGDHGKSLATEAMVISTELFGPNSVVAAKQIMKLGRIHANNKEFEEAIGCYQQALIALEHQFKMPHPDVVSVYDKLGQIHLVDNDIPRAIAAMKTATKISGQIWGEESIEYAARANQLGVAYHADQQLEMALKILQASEVIRGRKLGPEHEMVAHSLLNMGIVLLDMKQGDDAIKCLAQAVRIFKKPNVNQPTYLLKAQDRLSTAFMLNNKPDQAEPLLSDIVENARQQLGPNNSTVADYVYRYGISLARQGKYDMAEPVFQQAYTIQNGLFTEAHPSTIQTMQAMALLLKQTRRDSQAQEMMEKVRVAQRRNSNSVLQR